MAISGFKKNAYFQTECFLSGKVCPNLNCDGYLEVQPCRGHCGYPVTHFWRHVHSIGILFQVRLQEKANLFLQFLSYLIIKQSYLGSF